MEIFRESEEKSFVSFLQTAYKEEGSGGSFPDPPSQNGECPSEFYSSGYGISDIQNYI